MRRILLVLALAGALAFDATDAPKTSVLITGATGRTGRALYTLLKKDTSLEVRAFVTSAEKARTVLNCSACDASEGIYVGNVTQPATLAPAVAGVNLVAIAVGASVGMPPSLQKAIEFDGVQNTVAALASQPKADLSRMRVVFCSSMGTTQHDPPPPPREGGSLLFWKLQAEAFLLASGISSAVIKPCGLVDTPGGERTLLVGHDDTLLSTSPPIVPRADVARLMARALIGTDADDRATLRFDLCSKSGSPTLDLDALLRAAQYSWARPA